MVALLFGAVGEAIGGSELDEDFRGCYEEGAGTHRPEENVLQVRDSRRRIQGLDRKKSVETRDSDVFGNLEEECLPTGVAMRWDCSSMERVFLEGRGCLFLREGFLGRVLRPAAVAGRCCRVGLDRLPRS
jgi:hypothetical protein